MGEIDLMIFFDMSTEEEIRKYAIEEGINELTVMFSTLDDIKSMLYDRLWVRG